MDGKRFTKTLALAIAALVGATTLTLSSTSLPAEAAQSYRTTADIGRRYQPTTNPDGGYGMAANTTLEVICQTEGQPHGQYGNRLYFLTKAPRENANIYIPDAYTNSPHQANQPPIPGIPMCGQQQGQQGQAPLVWVGSPIDGTWDLPANRGGDGAAAHHWLGNARDKGDFAIDLIAPAGQSVQVYAAPQDGRTGITARIDQVGAACRGGANGGQFVTVGLYAGSQRVGSATYAHISPTVSVGQSISRWGGQVGTVGTGYPRNSECWTGPHVHTQVFSTKNYGCYNGGYALGQTIRKSNFFAFTGGNKASAPRRSCP